MICGIGIVNAQYIEDALRYATPNGINSARVGALGISFNGISDDFNATNFNPAGLSLIAKSELNVGLDFQHNGNEVNFINNISKFSSNNVNFSQVGMVFPFKTENHNAAISIGYIQESNFSNKYEYSGFNPKNTYTGYQTQYGTRNYQDNWAYHIFLASPNLQTAVRDSLHQSAYVDESGGLHNFVVGGAFEINPSLSIGATFNYKWGQYKYTRAFTESDTIKKYNRIDTVLYETSNINSVDVNESIDQQVTGISGSIGIIGKLSNFMRLGATIKFPSYYTIKENYGIFANAKFKSVLDPNPYDPDLSAIDYHVTTPFVFSGGMSFNMTGFTVTAGIEYMDATQVTFTAPDGSLVNFREINDHFNGLNKTIATSLVGQITWGIGFEYDLLVVPVVVRGSYQSITSPYSDNIDGANRQTIGFGAGIYVGDNVRIDGLYRWTSYSQLRTNYGTQETGSLYILKQTPTNIAVQLTYRY